MNHKCLISGFLEKHILCKARYFGQCHVVITNSEVYCATHPCFIAHISFQIVHFRLFRNRFDIVFINCFLLIAICLPFQNDRIEMLLKINRYKAGFSFFVLQHYIEQNVVVLTMH